MKKWGILIYLLGILFIGGCQKEVETPIEEIPEEIEETQEEPVQEVEEEPVIEEESHEGEAINPLTGLWIDEEVAKRRPVGIMINNFTAAIPQSGVGKADVIYETLVEGGITRLFAVFQDFEGSEKIGPIRSARHYFLDYAFDHDAIYAHIGQSTQALEAFSALNVPHFEALEFRSTDRKAPHNAYASYDFIMKVWENIGYREGYKEDYIQKFQFSEEEVALPATISAKKVITSFSNDSDYDSWFEYDEATGLYKRFHMEGNPHIDAETQEQLTFKNIIVQSTDMWVIPGDAYYRIDQELITTGTGYYITNGNAIEITWEKKDHYSPTKYYDLKGDEILLNKGKTWIAVFPSYREITLE